MTGTSNGGSHTTGDDYATIAYRAPTGAQLWVKRYNGPASDTDKAAAIAISPTGKMLFVTGYSTETDTNFDYATIGYNSATGKQLWIKRCNGSGNGADYAYSIAVSPSGGTVYVTGSTSATSNERYGTIAYSATSGARLWLQIYNNSSIGPDAATAVTVDPTSGAVFVTGSSYGYYGTIAYQG